MSLFEELKRRNVFRVGIAYLVGAWVLLQIVDFVLDAISAPNWILQVFILVAAVGLPVALIVSWVFEMTPAGIKRESHIDRNHSITPATGRKLDRVIIAFMAVAILILVADRFLVGGRSAAESSADSRAIAFMPSGTPTETESTNAPVGARSAAESSDDGTPEQNIVNAKSIAVLPFVNMSSDPEQEYFSDGITEEILNRLAGVRGLQVVARTSVFSFKGHNQDVREIAQLLGVSNILEGSVRKADDQVRITAQLIRASDGFHLWSESYDRKLENIFAIQDDIAGQIAGALEISLGVSAQPLVQSAKLVNPEVYDLYLRARALHRQRGVGVLEAIELFEEALVIDPEFAPAWAGLSHAYIVVPNYISADDWQRLGDVLEKSMAAAEIALQLDPNLPTALHAMGNNQLFRFEWAKAEEYYRRALELDPDSADIMEDYLSLLMYSWQLEEAIRIGERMIELDSNVPIFLMQVSLANFAAGELEIWEESIQKALEIGPELDVIRITNIIRLMHHGSVDEARANARLLNPETSNSDNMLQLIDWMSDPEKQPGPAVLAGFRNASMMLALLAGRYDIWLEVVEKTGAEWPEWELTESIDLLAPLAPPEVMHQYRADPRTRAWLSKIRLPEYWRKVGWPDICQPIGEDDFECN